MSSPPVRPGLAVVRAAGAWAYAAIAVGGAVGALARYGIAEAIPRAAPNSGLQDAGAGTTWPWATFIANIVGCLVVGLVVHAIVERPSSHRLARPLLVTGLLGGFTTFSALGVESIDLVNSGHAFVAYAYIASSLVLGVLSVSVSRRWVGAR